MGYYAAPSGRVACLCLLDGVLPYRTLLQGCERGTRQIKTTLAYLGRSMLHNYKFGVRVAAQLYKQVVRF